MLLLTIQATCLLHVIISVPSFALIRRRAKKRFKRRSRFQPTPTPLAQQNRAEQPARVFQRRVRQSRYRETVLGPYEAWRNGLNNTNSEEEEETNEEERRREGPITRAMTREDPMVSREQRNKM